MLTVGMYGETLPPQDGAPVRLIVPWKYGFKSIKSIVKIKLTGGMPPTTWNMSNSHEYGFYSNVNPKVDHPRWSQATERRLPATFKNHPTQMFNGYGDQVASLYYGHGPEEELLAMLRRRWMKVVVFLLCLAPLPGISAGASTARTSPPIRSSTSRTSRAIGRSGSSSATLAITPLRKLLRLPDLIRFRRMIGLYAFFYASLHFLTYLWLDRFFDFHDIGKDIAKRPFITAGFPPFVC